MIALKRQCFQTIDNIISQGKCRLREYVQIAVHPSDTVSEVSEARLRRTSGFDVWLYLETIVPYKLAPLYAEYMYIAMNAISHEVCTYWPLFRCLYYPET